MRILAWNIQHGGGTRLARIVEEVSAYDPDLIALTEYRGRPGALLTAEFRARGWTFAETSRPSGNQNGIAVFSRLPIARRFRCPVHRDYRERWLDIDVPGAGFGIGVLHIMAAGSAKSHPLNIAKLQFWETVLSAAKRRADEPFLFIGDWNTGAHRLDEKGKTFVCAEHFLQLSACGWTDLWRYHNRDTTEWTWYSSFGNPFRLDHAFATAALSRRVTACRYSHREREARVSDHSIVIVDLD